MAQTTIDATTAAMIAQLQSSGIRLADPRAGASSRRGGAGPSDHKAVTIDGQLRPVQVRDRTVSADVTSAERADPKAPGHVAAPYDGAVTVTVAEGDSVEAGQTVATIEAMKMEASITAPVSGTVTRLAIPSTKAAEGGDLVLVIG